MGQANTLMKGFPGTASETGKNAGLSICETEEDFERIPSSVSFNIIFLHLNIHCTVFSDHALVLSSSWHFHSVRGVIVREPGDAGVGRSSDATHRQSGVPVWSCCPGCSEQFCFSPEMSS